MLVARTNPAKPNPARTNPAPARRDHERIRCRELGPDTVLLAVTGDVDAAVSSDLVDRITSSLGVHHQLVLDVSGVGFFGTAGYTLLQQLGRHCARYSIDWVAVIGPEVRRLLRACAPPGCDPFGVFPTADNIVSAVAALARGPHRVSLLPPH